MQLNSIIVKIMFFYLLRTSLEFFSHVVNPVLCNQQSLWTTKTSKSSVAWEVCKAYFPNDSDV
uniref:Uncharacterized protein n=1 Tax=Arundo donax TaxID=35708 RepID=A0A0A9DP76_ARUDO